MAKKCKADEGLEEKKPDEANQPGMNGERS